MCHDSWSELALAGQHSGPTVLLPVQLALYQHSTPLTHASLLSPCAHRSTESIDSGNGTRISSSSYAPMHIIPRSDPLLDVQIGPLVGKGAYGRVYRGHWNGSQVRCPCRGCAAGAGAGAGAAAGAGAFVP
jgi:hypothetical protein